MKTDNTAPPHPDQLKWDQRYAAAQAPGSVAPVLREHAQLLPRQGRALDLACGLGANALFLARQGLTVSAWDLSPVAIAHLHGLAQASQLAIDAEARVITPHTLPTKHFDVIVVSRFLDRGLCPAILAALRPGGLLYYQTFTRAPHPQHPRHEASAHRAAQGPRNADYLLGPGELLALFAGLRVVFYREEAALCETAHAVRNEAQYIGLNHTAA